MDKKLNIVSDVIVSRAILEDYGYDGNLPTDEEMQIIADELICYWYESKGYEDALSSTMTSLYGEEDTEEVDE